MYVPANQPSVYVYTLETSSGSKVGAVSSVISVVPMSTADDSMARGLAGWGQQPFLAYQVEEVEVSAYPRHPLEKLAAIKRQ